MKFIVLVMAISLVIGVLPCLAEEAEDVTISGEANFIDYYSIEGKKCSGILEGSDGTHYCILDNATVLKLKDTINKNQGDVKISGTVIQGRKEKLLDVKEYEIINNTK